MNTIARRIAAGATLAIAPAIIALGTATAGHADTAPANNGPSSSTASASTQHWDPNTPGARQFPNHHNKHYFRAG
ncbi:MAG: hypothetical protein U0Q20_03850 [Mycobacterium sp.]|nr:hypothetical protein [Mycobacterium sp.]